MWVLVMVIYTRYTYSIHYDRCYIVLHAPCSHKTFILMYTYRLIRNCCPPLCICVCSNIGKVYSNSVHDVREYVYVYYDSSCM